MPARTASFAASLSDLGETGRLIADHDWSATPLGPVEGWPQNLRIALGMVLRSPVPIVMLWGEDGIMLYNDAYSGFAGRRHPALLGSKVREGWPEVAEFNDNVMKVGLAGGTLAYRDQELTLNRNGGPERAWLNLDYSPVPDESGRPAGVIAIVAETTERVLAERRQAFRLALEERLRAVQDARKIQEAAAEALGTHLAASRCGYAEGDALGRVAIAAEWHAPGTRALAGRHNLQDFGPQLSPELTAGRTIVVENVATDSRTVDPAVQAAYAAVGVAAHIAIPLVKAGRLAALLYVHSPTPRHWSPEDVALAGDVAERTWAASERARAEAELRESEARRRTALAAARLGTFEWDLRTGRVDLDERSRDIFGFAGEVARADAVFGRIHPDDVQRVRAAVGESIAALARLDVEYRILLTDGTERTVGSLSDIVAGPDGGPEKAVGVFADVTAGRAAAVALARGEEQLRLATEAAEIGLWDVEPASGAMFWQARVKRMFGLSPDAAVSMDDFYAGLHPEDRAAVAEAFAAACDPARRALYDVEYRTVGREDGVIRWVAAKGRGLFERGRCVRVLGTAIDVTRRKADEARLRELNEELERRVAEALAGHRLLASVIENARVFVQVADTEFRWLAINRAASEEFSRIFGVRRPQEGDSMLELLDHLPEQREAVRAVWARALGGEEFVEEGAFGDTSHDRRFYEMRFHSLRDPEGKLIGAYQFVYDVTESKLEQARLREAEARLQQSQKMEAMGQLTGGIAHDFNNILQGVAGTLDLIRRRPGEADRVQRLATSAMLAAERGAKLTAQLLAFSRLQKLETAPVAVAKLALGMREMLERTLGPLVTITLDLEDEGGAVLTDPTQLELAILNMAINARDAMPGGGELAIRTRGVSLQGDPDLPAGDYVLLEVADTGSGMPPEVAARAFDPFYTTKPIGKGTGLGLSQVYGIARQSGGIARIESRPGHGTTIRLLLRGTGRAAPAEEPDREERLPPGSAHPRARVLVVDDDPDVRRFLAASLEDLGYAVQAAEDGETGLRLFHELQPDLLVLDYAMPGMSGAEVAQAAREQRPDVRIVFASGYSDTDAIEAAVGPDATVLRKPFTVDHLHRTVAGSLLRM